MSTSGHAPSCPCQAADSRDSREPSSPTLPKHVRKEPHPVHLGEGSKGIGRGRVKEQHRAPSRPLGLKQSRE